LIPLGQPFAPEWLPVPDPIRYLDRTDKTLKTEDIYGERWLRWAYENPVGRFAVWLLIRRAIFSRWYGNRMNRRSGIQLLPFSQPSDELILPFITKYNIDVGDFAKSPFDYKTFNEFFYRALKPGARPIAPGDAVAALPADGRHLAFQNVDEADGYYVKGAKFTLKELFGDASEEVRPGGADRSSAGGTVAGGVPTASRSLPDLFAGGSMLISRLCPVDYHRFHFPAPGIPGEPRLVNGFLYSVSPVALRRSLRYLVENRRVVTRIESSVFGTVAMIEVGATNVGSIRQSFVPGRPIQKGEEKGLFAFGGSCVITLFQKGRIRFDADLVQSSAEQIEVYARMGDRLGEAPG